jgi:PAS domain S-box-containing protein
MNRDRSHSPAKILIVDDTIDSLRLLANMLSEQGYNVRKVLNGQMALTAAQAAPPDLILLDINMPVLNGYEVCQQLKANEQTADIPVLFVSALDEVLDKVKAFAVGGVDYITKPFQFEEVVARVETQLTIRFLSQQLTEQTAKAQAAEARYRRLFENAVEGIFQISPDGFYQSLNPALARLYGYKSPEIAIATIGNVSQLYVNPNRWYEIVTFLEEHELGASFDSQVYRADGKSVSICENIYAIRDSQRQLLYYEGTVIPQRDKSNGLS